MESSGNPTVDRILEIELEMFLAVPTEGDCECKENLPAFGIQRRAQFLAWSERSRLSWLADLEAARRAGRNLMTLKYARMEGKLPRRNRSPLVPELLEEMVAFQRAFLAGHAGIQGKARPIEEGEGEARSFSLYLESELETYSEATLRSLLVDVMELKAAGRNLSAEIYARLVEGFGYSSVEAAEASIVKGD